MKQTFVFRKLSPELEEVLMEELHTLKGGNGGGSENWLNEVVIEGEAPKEEEEEEEEEDDDYEDPEIPDPWDDPSGWWWGGGSDPADENSPIVNCNLSYSGMPMANGSNKQPLNTCGPHMLSQLSTMSGNNTSIDSIINSIVSGRTGGQTSGDDFINAKIDVMQNGITMSEFDNYVNSNFLSSDIDGDFSSIQAAIKVGKPVTSHFVTDMVYNSSGHLQQIVTHAVMITGVTSNGGVTYYDPQTDKYHTEPSAVKFLNTKSIDLGQEIQVQCAD